MHTISGKGIYRDGQLVCSHEDDILMISYPYFIDVNYDLYYLNVDTVRQLFELNKYYVYRVLTTGKKATYMHYYNYLYRYYEGVLYINNGEVNLTQNTLTFINLDVLILIKNIISIDCYWNEVDYYVLTDTGDVYLRATKLLYSNIKQIEHMYDTAVLLTNDHNLVIDNRHIGEFDYHDIHVDCDILAKNIKYFITFDDTIFALDENNNVIHINEKIITIPIITENKIISMYVSGINVYFLDEYNILWRINTTKLSLKLKKCSFTIDIFPDNTPKFVISQTKSARKI